MPVFVAATLRVGLALTELLPEAERDTLAEPVAELAAEPVTDAEGEIVGSIVCVEDGAAEAELLGEGWAEKDATEAVGVSVPLRLPVRETDGVSVWDHVRKSVDVDVAEARTEPVTEPETVLLPTTLLLGDTEAVLVLDTELLPESVELLAALRVVIHEPVRVTVAEEVLEAADDADRLIEPLGVLDASPDRVFVGDTVDVLLAFELVVPLIVAVSSDDCVPSSELLLETV